MPLDPYQFVSDLEQLRYRVVLLHAAPSEGAAVTQFVKKVCSHFGGKYLDLLDLFIQNAELGEHIDSFSPEKFRDLLREQSIGRTLLVIDRLDFLLDTWSRTEKRVFYGLIDKNQWDSYKEGMKARLVLCLQTSPEIAALQSAGSEDHRRVLRLSDFNDVL